MSDKGKLMNSFYRLVAPVIGLVAMLLSMSPAAMTLDCDRLTGDQKSFCEDLAMCSLIGNVGAREQCVSAVVVSEQKQVVAPERPLGPRFPDAAAPVAAAATTLDSDQVIVKIRPREERDQNAQAVWTEPDGDAETDESAKIPIRRMEDIEIPRRFDGVVKGVRHLVRNRQVILLDNNLLFDGEGHYDEDTKVRVVRKRLGGRFIMTHKGGNNEFDRIECERPDSGLKKKQRKWCNMFFKSNVSVP